MSQLFYVPVVLVIDAASHADADIVVKQLLDGVVNVQPKHMNGYFLMSEADNTPACQKWDSAMQRPSMRDGRLKIEELAP